MIYTVLQGFYIAVVRKWPDVWNGGFRSKGYDPTQEELICILKYC